MNLYRIVYSFLFVGVASRPSYFNPRKSEPGQHSWWYGFGDDWDTTDDLEKSTSSLATFNYMKKQMDTYGYAQHIGTINRGHLLNPEANSPRDRAFGYGGDFNPRDYSGGAFRYKPLGNKFSQNTYATQAMVDLGMSSRVGELVKVPIGVLVQADGTVLLTLDARERRLDPCTPNPCDERGYYTFTCEVVNHFTVKCSRPASYDLTLQWSWAASNKKEADRKSYLALGVTAVKKSDPTVSCAVVSSNYMLNTVQMYHKGPGPKCGVSISSVKDTYDAAGNIVSGGVTLHFGQVESDKSDYKEYTYAVMAYYYCEDEVQPQSPPCVEGIHEAAHRIRLVKSIAGEDTRESYDIPRESARKRRSTDPNDQNKPYFFFGIFNLLFGILNTSGSNFYFIYDYVFSDKTLGDLNLASSAFVEKELRPSCFYTDLPPCDVTSKYRTVTGQCNNVQNHDLGKKNSVLKRLLNSEYDDGISAPRILSVVYGYNLPSPRSVSLIIHTAQETHDPQFNLNMMQWGQFIDHDFALIPINTGFNKEVSLDCRACDSFVHNPGCFPIPIPSDEPFYPTKPSPQCMAFTRSEPAIQVRGPREHMNEVTHFLDASMLYSSDSCKSTKLRKDNHFMFKMEDNKPRKDLLPLCMLGECRAADNQCFIAGDVRVNEQPALTTFHTLLFREHNDISGKLSTINPNWSTEKVFQETRRIIGAIIQHITYKEYLPRILGQTIMQQYSLELLPSGYFNGYNPQCTGVISTEFSTAAWRFGHSMIRSNLALITEDEMLKGEAGKQVALTDVFFNSDLLRTQTLDDVVRGLLMTPMGVVDNLVSTLLSTRLFEEKGKEFSGMDIAAINIQRGRDHGIPGYNKYRHFCGLTRATSFAEFSPEIPQTIIDKLQLVYRHPDDVDLFPGLLVETKLPGAIVGPTLACLIGHQFRDLRNCDRFWYETEDPLLKFTADQLKEIRDQTLSALLCRNYDEPGKIQAKGFDLMDTVNNPLGNCVDLKQINLQHWRE